MESWSGRVIETAVLSGRIIVLGTIGVLHAEPGGYYLDAHLEAEPRPRPIFCEMVNDGAKRRQTIKWWQYTHEQCASDRLS